MEAASLTLKDPNVQMWDDFQSLRVNSSLTCVREVDGLFPGTGTVSLSTLRTLDPDCFSSLSWL